MNGQGFWGKTQAGTNSTFAGDMVSHVYVPSTWPSWNHRAAILVDKQLKARVSWRDRNKQSNKSLRKAPGMPMGTIAEVLATGSFRGSLSK